MKNIILLGTMGSIGRSCIDIFKENKDKFRIIGMSFYNNLDNAQELIDLFLPEVICLKSKDDIKKIKFNGPIFYGDKGLLNLVRYNKENTSVINALSGISGLMPSIETIKSKKNLLLANKESLVLAGPILMDLSKKNKSYIIPIDSEHTSLLSLINGKKKKDIKKIILTCSGGPLRDKDTNAFIKKDDVLNHPTWNMGEHITVNSATLMNKIYETIEAHYLFDLPYSNIECVINYESLIHSMIMFEDFSYNMSLSVKDMKVHIIYALTYPNYVSNNLDKINFDNLRLSFDNISLEKYSFFYKVKEYITKDIIYSVLLQISNEICVKLFLDNLINFYDIEKCVIDVLENKEFQNIKYNLENIFKLQIIIKKYIYNKFDIK